MPEIDWINAKIRLRSRKRVLTVVTPTSNVNDHTIYILSQGDAAWLRAASLTTTAAYFDGFYYGTLMQENILEQERKPERVADALKWMCFRLWLGSEYEVNCKSVIWKDLEVIWASEGLSMLAREYLRYLDVSQGHIDNSILKTVSKNKDQAISLPFLNKGISDSRLVEKFRTNEASTTLLINTIAKWSGND